MTATRQQDTYNIALIDIFPSGHYQDLHLDFPSCFLFSIHHFPVYFSWLHFYEEQENGNIINFLVICAHTSPNTFY